MTLAELFTELKQKLEPSSLACARAWLEAPGSLTAWMERAAANKLRYTLEDLGWFKATATEQAIWPHFIPGEQLWQRAVAFSVAGVGWLQARVLMPASSLTGAAGVALQYCGAQSLGGALFQDPALSRASLGYGYENHPEHGLCVVRHGLYRFFSQPVVITESFLPHLWQRPLPKVVT
jgi:chorismate-pyruvate lyase